MSNAIVLENQKKGNPQSDWGLTYGAAVGNIEGYANDLSVGLGGNVEFKVNTDATDYRIDIYRLGYYGGDGARLVGSIEHNGPAPLQPAPLKDITTGLVDAGNWSVTDSWHPPSDAISGVYLAKLVRQDGTFGESRIPFILRDDASTSDIVFQTSDTTWEAYNPWGGNSLYMGNASGDGFQKAVSYNRPMALDTLETTTTLYGPESYLFGGEYAAIRWLEKNGYDVTYQTGIDTARYGQLLTNHHIFLSVGHDEYWSAEQRANVEAARDAGVNLSFWSGNTMFWKTRLDVGITGDAYKTIVTYKESYPGVSPDPSNIWTGLWADPRGVGEGGNEPANALTGTEFAVNLGTPLTSIQIPYSICGCFLWANTQVAKLQPGETWTLNGNYLGYEWDVDTLNSVRPAGLIQLSSTTVDVPYLLQSNDVDFGPGTATHNLTMYRDDSGALVFSAGSVFWSWALDDFHVYGPVGPNQYTPTDPNAEQAMVNLFAQMGVQPNSLSWYLSRAQKTTDTIAPDSHIVGFVTNQKVTAGSTITFNGTATDTGGGVVVAVEISTDGGLTWKPTVRDANWSYTWTVPDKLGPVSILTRAIDDSLNAEKSDETLVLNVVAAQPIVKTPVSVITNYIDWNLVGAGQSVVITGSAVDPDKGWIGGVELSADGGKTWKAATGGEDWAYIWNAPTQVGFYDLLYRAGDNDSNLEKYNTITLSVTAPDTIVFGKAPPHSGITDLIDGQTVAAGSTFKVTGTAFDINPDGFVGGVELSLDGGATWKTAVGTSQWSFDWQVPDQVGVYKLQYRAGDNDFNLEAARTVLVNVVDSSAVVHETPNGPASSVTNVGNWHQLGAGQSVTITGAAIDQDGGRIGGVEYSIDGGVSWTAASGTSEWSFAYQSATQGLKTILYRAGDNDLHLESANTLILDVVDPSTLPSGLPHSSVQNLNNGQKLAPGTSLKVLGSALDTDGTVSQVEVSVDEGYTWKPATGTDQWSYDWTVPSDEGVYKFQYRAVDNDHHLEAVHTVLVQAQDLLLL